MSGDIKDDPKDRNVRVALWSCFFVGFVLSAYGAALLWWPDAQGPALLLATGTTGMMGAAVGGFLRTQ